MKKLKSVWFKVCLVCLAAGTVFAAAGFCMGGGKYMRGEKYMSNEKPSSGEFTLNETYSDIKNLDISLAFTNLEITEGEEFSVSGIDIDPKKLELENDKGTLRINSKSHNFLNNFGINLDHGINIGFTDKAKSKLIVTVPKGTHFDEVSLEMGAGSLKVSDMNCDDLEVSVGAGEGTMENISVTNHADAEVGAGTLNLRNITANELVLEAGMGEIVLDGMAEVYCAASCGMGTIAINLKDNLEKYTYAVECGMGEVRINDDHYSGIGTGTKKGNGEKTLNLECGMGTIEVQIQP